MASSVHERGEFVVVVGPRELGQEALATPSEPVVNLIGRLANVVDFSPGEMVRIVASVNGISERAATKAIKKHNISVKRQNDRLA
jgi:hypothetical protein